jgi:hypothetical protein
MPSTKAIPDAILYTDGKYFEHTGVIEMLRFLIEDEPIFEVDTLQSKPWYSHAKNIVMNNFADKVLLLLNLDLRSRLSEL